MHPRTIATLDELEKAAWFSRVGVKDAEFAIVLSSWHEAIEYCSSDEWLDLCLEAVNQYCERLVERSVDRFRKWNEVAIEVKRTTEPFVRRKIEQVVREHNLPPVFEHTVQWDMIHLCMEAEYADVYPPGFFASHAYWYLNGHFPCGWQGDFPKGALVIY
ncbi:MAG: hypothetical protein ACJ8LM_15360 [Candidatus Udaeobacter sp.]